MAAVVARAVAAGPRDSGVAGRPWCWSPAQQDGDSGVAGLCRTVVATLSDLMGPPPRLPVFQGLTAPSGLQGGLQGLRTGPPALLSLCRRAPGPCRSRC